MRGGPAGNPQPMTRRSSTTIAAAIVHTSVGDRPNRIAVSNRPAATAAARPSTTPTATMIIDSRSTIPTTPRRCAPSAMRMPISLGAARHAVGHQPEQADAGQQQRQPAEQRVGEREQALLRDAAFDLIGLRGHAGERQLRIDLPHGGTYRLDQLDGSPAVRTITVAADAFPGRTRYSVARRGLAKAVVLGVLDDADDLGAALPLLLRRCCRCVGRSDSRRRSTSSRPFR